MQLPQLSLQLIANARSEQLRIALLDLVEIAPTAKPPVCKVMDYGKYLFQQKKKANEAKKKQVVITVKEIKFRPGTDVHDYTYRMKRARESVGNISRKPAITCSAVGRLPRCA